MITGVTIWTHYTVLNTNGYMNLVGTGRQGSAGDQGAERLRVDPDRHGERPAGAGAGRPAAESPVPRRPDHVGAVQSFIDKQTVKVLSTPQAYNLWLGSTASAHQQIVGLLRGQNNYTYIQGSDVKLNPLPLVSQALVWLDGKLPGALSSKFSPPVIAPGTPGVGLHPAGLAVVRQDAAGRLRPGHAPEERRARAGAEGHQALRQPRHRPADHPRRAHRRDDPAVAAPAATRSSRSASAAPIALIITYVIIKRASAAIVGGLHLGSVNEVVKNVVTASLGPLATITIWIVVIGAIVAIVAWLVGRKDVQTVIVDAGKKVVEVAGLRRSAPRRRLSAGSAATSSSCASWAWSPASSCW